jgi:hypothetical protein
MGVPAEQLLKDLNVEAAQTGIEFTKNLQQLVVAGELLEATEKVQEERATGSEVDALGANQGNTVSPHTSKVIEIDSSTTLDSHSTSVSNSSTSSDMDDVPLNKIYEKLDKSLSPSSSTKLHKKPADNTPYEPMYLSVDDIISNEIQSL